MTEAARSLVEADTVPDWLWAQDDQVPVSSNVGAGNLPFQRWFRFKEAYSPVFVTDAVAACNYAVRHLLDPFGGSGTTALTARMEGLDSTSIEVNPFLADLIRAKVTPISSETFAISCRQIVERTRVVRGDYRIIECAPPTLVEPGVKGRYIYSRETYGALRALHRRIVQLDDEQSRLARVLLGSILVDCSNVIINGKGRRYRGKWQERRVTREDVFARFEASAARAVEDLSYFHEKSGSTHHVFNNDARSHLKEMPTCDLAIFSPPYPNSFDYTDVYNLELWMLGYLRSASDNRNLRKRTFRSHVQIVPEKELAGPATPKLKSLKEALDERRELMWNRHIPEMVVGYFADLEKVLHSLKKVLRPRGHVVAAVGDSQYGGVKIDTAGILAEIAERLGFEVEAASEIRSMRASAQHGGGFDLSETALRLRSLKSGIG